MSEYIYRVFSTDAWLTLGASQNGEEIDVTELHTFELDQYGNLTVLHKKSDDWVRLKEGSYRIELVLLPQPLTDLKG